MKNLIVVLILLGVAIAVVVAIYWANRKPADNDKNDIGSKPDGGGSSHDSGGDSGGGSGGDGGGE